MSSLKSKPNLRIHLLDLFTIRNFYSQKSFHQLQQNKNNHASPSQQMNFHFSSQSNLQ